MQANSTQTQNPSTLNRARLVGRIADLKRSTGPNKTKPGEYTSIRGMIQVGEDPSFRVPFQYMQSSVRKDGNINPMYADFTEWVDTLTSVAQTGEGSHVHLVGSYEPNEYVSANGSLVKGYVVRALWRNAITPEMEDCFELDIRGSVTHVVPEIEDEQETGRLKVQICGLDYRSCGIPFEFVVPQEYASQFETLYQPGTTGDFYITYEVKQTAPKVKTGGIGQLRTTPGRNLVVPIMTGAEDPFSEESPEFLTPDVVQSAINEYRVRVKEIEDAGYQGNSASAQNPRTASAGRAMAMGQARQAPRSVPKPVSTGLSGFGDDDFTNIEF